MRPFEDLRKDVAELVGVSPEALDLKTTVSPKVVRGKMLLAYILAKDSDDEDYTDIQRRLNCTKGFVQLAIARFRESETFRADVEKLSGPAAEPPGKPKQPEPGSVVLEEVVTETASAPETIVHEPTEPVQDPVVPETKTGRKPKSDNWVTAADAENKLFCIGEHYGFDREAIRKGLSESLTARRIMALVAKRVYSIAPRHLAEILGCTQGDVQHLLQDSAYDVLYEPPFIREVDIVCAKFNIDLDRKIHVRD